MWIVAADRRFVRGGAGVNRSAGEAGGRSAERRADDGRGSFPDAAQSCNTPGGAVLGAAGWRRAVFAKPEQIAEHRPKAGNEEPIYRAYQSSGGWIQADAVRSALSNHGGAIPCAAGSDEGRHRHVYGDGGQQLEQRHSSAGPAQSEPRSLVCEDEWGVLRFGGNAFSDGARNWRAGYVDRPASSGGESIVCKSVLRKSQSDRTAHWRARTQFFRSLRGRRRGGGYGLHHRAMKGPWYVFRPTHAAAGAHR